MALFAKIQDGAWPALRVASGDAESLRGALARAKADHAEALLKERVTREEAEQVFAEAGELHAGQQAQIGAALRARGEELSAAATALEESAAKAAQLAEDLARLEGLQAEALSALLPSPPANSGSVSGVQREAESPLLALHRSLGTWYTLVRGCILGQCRVLPQRVLYTVRARSVTSDF